MQRETWLRRHKEGNDSGGYHTKAGGEYHMQILLDRIRKDGVVKAGNVLKVDRFLNHQMDIGLFREIGKEFKRRFADTEINKILTIEA